ncbi:MAG: addiction module protein [Verrucomicrobiales bacterium]|nr:addiction module protein [Verrucomicrobiales bacterium]
MSTVTELISNALDLPRTDRTYLAKKLLESLGEAEELSNEEQSTIVRRSRELKEGVVKGLSLDELKEIVRQKTA